RCHVRGNRRAARPRRVPARRRALSPARGGILRPHRERPRAMKNGGNGFKRTDFDAIAGWIRPGSRVLDLGCGDGVLLKYLKGARDITGYGVEIDDANVLACVTNGVNVIQSDLERGLSEFETGSFDYVILSQTL